MALAASETNWQLANTPSVMISAAALGVCRAHGTSVEALDLIGSHGHTIWHEPPEAGVRGATIHKIMIFTYGNGGLGADFVPHCHKYKLAAATALVLDADYFRRIDALNFTMEHDDGQLPEDIEEADIILVGISRTSKTPTSIYLANRGIKTANVPIVLDVPIPDSLTKAERPLIQKDATGTTKFLGGDEIRNLRDIAARLQSFPKAFNCEIHVKQRLPKVGPKTAIPAC